MLGIRHVGDTICGNERIRGVSGGVRDCGFFSRGAWDVFFLISMRFGDHSVSAESKGGGAKKKSAPPCQPNGHSEPPDPSPACAPRPDSARRAAEATDQCGDHGHPHPPAQGPCGGGVGRHAAPKCHPVTPANRSAACRGPIWMSRIPPPLTVVHPEVYQVRRKMRVNPNTAERMPFRGGGGLTAGPEGEGGGLP